MQSIASIKEQVSKRASETLDELEGYFKDDAEMLAAIEADNDRIDEARHEMADGRVSVYTHDQMEWLTANIGRADQENAIACGAKTAQEIAAYCWYEAEREDIEEDLSDVRAAIEKLEE